MVYRMLKSGPKILGGIGTPGTPTGATFNETQCDWLELPN
ncbi:hypothetical protein HMPREF0591_1828 [Mycobacterium parascrofulaceum ATCC BAA-614]|uniref:Uncharacterized protein n=1 Tax=Mycobacterium parascrofulaceum ATCC BAA-614 TaxID=525368 RepID=D5P6N4_9MYCO|nr:hypothetical protein HMPREF0591_1828 [Mycobacterium parascrofulaceum ATCC BAA-614]